MQMCAAGVLHGVRHHQQLRGAGHAVRPQDGRIPRCALPGQCEALFVLPGKALTRATSTSALCAHVYSVYMAART